MQLRRRTDKQLTTERRGTVEDRRIAPPPGELNLTDVLHSVDRLLYDAKHKRRPNLPLSEVAAE